MPNGLLVVFKYECGVCCSFTCYPFMGTLPLLRHVRQRLEAEPAYYLLILNKLADWNDTWMMKRGG